MKHLVLAVAIIEPLAILPQLLNVLRGRIEGVSLTTWAAFSVLTGVLLAHAISIDDTAFIVSETMYLVLQVGLAWALILKRRSRR